MRLNISRAKVPFLLFHVPLSLSLVYYQQPLFNYFHLVSRRSLLSMFWPRPKSAALLSFASFLYAYTEIQLCSDTSLYLSILVPPRKFRSTRKLALPRKSKLFITKPRRTCSSRASPPLQLAAWLLEIADQVAKRISG